ncbi:MAG: hypothetical protein ACRELB_04520 [Polyangiaceae bacterium]
MDPRSTPNLTASSLLTFLFLLSLSGCERGCARTWLKERGASERGVRAPGAQPVNGVDCPDGLARCTGGVVTASRLAVIEQPCKGTAEQCSCPWERVGECERGCVADELEVVVDRGAAMRQLCAPPRDAGPVARELAPPPASRCEEGELYRCASGSVVSCADHAVVAVCAKGCATEGGSLDDDMPVAREAAYAVLCSR